MHYLYFITKTVIEVKDGELTLENDDLLYLIKIPMTETDLQRPLCDLRENYYAAHPEHRPPADILQFPSGNYIGGDLSDPLVEKYIGPPGTLPGMPATTTPKQPRFTSRMGALLLVASIIGVLLNAMAALYAGYIFCGAPESSIEKMTYLFSSLLYSVVICGASAGYFQYLDFVKHRAK